MADRARQIAELSDDPIAFSTLQEGLAYCETSYGYIAYRRVLGVDITLGPPIAAPADRAALIDRFLRTSRRPVFLLSARRRSRSGTSAGRTHHGRHLRLSGMGLDRLIDGRAFADPSALSKPLRGARKHAQRAGFRVERIEPSALNASQRQAGRHHPRLSFARPTALRDALLNRPFTLAYGQLGHPASVCICCSKRLARPVNRGSSVTPC